MPIQSLGIFDSVFDWVCDKLFDPVISWLSKILNSIFEWIIDNVVVPLIKPVFEFLWNIVIANIMDVFYKMIYNGYCEFLWFFDQLQSGFDVLIGLQDVTYVDSTGVKTQSTMLEYFINNEIIRNALISITFVALALSMIFAIYSVIRSTLDFDFEGKRPVGKVLNSVAKSMIAFLLVPLIAVVGIQLSSIVLKQTCIAISGSSDTSLGRWVLAISSMDAGMGNPPASFTGSNGQIAEPWASLIAGDIDYAAFGTLIHESRVDYILGFISIIFMGIVLMICLFTFIKRIFDIVILYITSPYFVSTIVLDDGEKFRRWRETFIAKLLVGFGSVIGLRIFLMMVPAIMSDDLSIFDSVAGNATGGYVIRLVFILGGMFAVYKSSTLLTGIISSGVAANENASNALLSGMVMGGAVKGAKLAAGAGLSAFSELRKKKNEKKSDTKGNKFSDDAGKVNMPSQAKFSSAYAAAMTGKHNEIDTSDYAPLLGKTSYLKDGVKAQKVRPHYEADQDELMADGRDMFGDGQQDAASRSFEEAFNAATGQHSEMDISDYDPNAGINVYYKSAMEADKSQKELAAKHEGVTGKKKPGSNYGTRKRANTAPNPKTTTRKNVTTKKFVDPLDPDGKIRAAEKARAEAARAAAAGSNAAKQPASAAESVKNAGQSASGSSAFAGSEPIVVSSMNTDAEAVQTSENNPAAESQADTVKVGVDNSAADIAARHSSGIASVSEISESRGAANDNSASSRSEAFSEQLPSEHGMTMNTGSSVESMPSEIGPSASGSSASVSSVSSSSASGSAAGGSSAGVSASGAAETVNNRKSAAPKAVPTVDPLVPTVDPLKVHKKTDHRNDSGKF